MLEHVEDEAFLDRLLHRVAVEGPVLDLARLAGRLAEDFQRLVLRRGGEGEIARVRQHLAGLHAFLEGVVDRRLPGRPSASFIAADVLAALAGVGLVDDDGEFASAVLAADFVEDEGEFLDGRDDDLLAALDEPAQVAGMLGVADGRADLGELLDGVADLLVEDAAVGDDDDRVERLLVACAVSPMSWWASQAIEFDLPLPAECWIRYRLPAPCVAASASSLRTTSS